MILLAVFASESCHKPALQQSLPRIQSTPRAPDGKPPIIFIPGILGSRLVNRRTGETVWPDLRADEIALPISSQVLAENRDDVVALEVLEEVRFNPFIPKVAVYGPLLKSLELYGGYQRGDEAAPSPSGATDTFYTFAYDWRRDIVESARALGDMIEDLKRRLGRPDLRFDIVAHSMGGLVARYYAMYGGRDVLDAQVHCPDWSGARNLGEIVMIGAPNAGSMNALRALLRGYSVAGDDPQSRKILGKLALGLTGGPISPRIVFTSPAVYQLLPSQQSARFFDGNLKPLSVRLYEIETWRRYKWSAAFDENIRRRELKLLVKDLGLARGKAESLRLLAERERFLRVALRRAAAFHNALLAESPPPARLRFAFIGGDCLATLDGAIILIGIAPRTIFHASNYPGGRWLRRKAEELILAPGDGSVTRHSLLGYPLNSNSAGAIPLAMRSTPVEAVFLCESHNGLIADAAAQNSLHLTLLTRQ